MLGKKRECVCVCAQVLSPRRRTRGLDAALYVSHVFNRVFAQMDRTGRQLSWNQDRFAILQPSESRKFSLSLSLSFFFPSLSHFCTATGAAIHQSAQSIYRSRASCRDFCQSFSSFPSFFFFLQSFLVKSWPISIRAELPNVDGSPTTREILYLSTVA